MRLHPTGKFDNEAVANQRIEVPPLGGDTTWANSALAYAMLSDTYRHMIDGLRVRFSMRDVLKSAQQAVETRDTPIGRLAATRDSARLSDDLLRKAEGSAHPLVRTHPVTGEKSAEESAPILEYLTDHLTQPAFTCRPRWEPGMLVAWDNRLCVHQAYNDYEGHRREMYRTTVRGERPA